MRVEQVMGSAAGTATSHQTYDVVHPGTGEVVHAVECSSPEDLERAVAICQDGIPSWSGAPASERAAIFRRAADLLDDPESGWSDKLANANLSETSVQPWWNRTQLAQVGSFIRALADATEEALAPWVVDGQHSLTHMSREPYGVCLAIAAWNACHLLTSRAIITPLLAGNTVILKSSEHVPLTQTIWVNLLHASGVPKDALCVVHISAKDAPRFTPLLIADKRIRHLNFTGSTNVGAILASQCGQNLKPCLMELGGKAPVLLLPNADLGVAASHIIFGTMMNSGQICMSTERIFVPQSRYQELVTCLRRAWTDVDKKPRALFSAASAGKVHTLLQDALQQGATSLLDDDSYTFDHSAFIKPAIYGPANAGMRVFREETFGPVSVVVIIDDNGRSEDEVIAEMVAHANDTDYGLTASIWTTEPAQGMRIASQLDCGAVHINSPTNHDLPHVPHGGWKSSGWGRFNGVEGIRSFTQTRSVEVSKGPVAALPLHIMLS